MKRAGTVTLPYTFCLFCGLLALVLSMAGAVTWQIRRDTRAAEPELASRMLQGALSPVAGTMKSLFAPPRNTIETIQQWAAQGTLSEQRADEWPLTCLPVVSPIEPIHSFLILKENGVCFRVVRNGQEWKGSIIDPTRPEASVQGGRWQLSGRRTSTGATESRSDDPRDSAWYKQIMGSLAQDGESRLVTETTGKSLTVAAPLRFAGGQRGCVAVEIDCTPLWTLAAPGGKVELVIDPDGRQTGLLQNEQTRALLEAKAVTGEHLNALQELYPPAASPDDYWYAAASCASGEGPAWWVVARVNRSDLPAPSLPLLRYLVWATGVGLAGSALLALIFGCRMTRPLRQVAARARGIHILDEHYLPWPRSRFTEVNRLTSALEEIYEAAVEHLDYHDAPLIVWAEPEQSAAEGMIDAEAVRHVFQFPRGNSPSAEAPASAGAVIDIDRAASSIALPEVVPAAQLQVLQGTRKELRRLQSQLTGACEELRTVDNHHQQDMARLKRQRNCLRSLERRLLSEGCASVGVLSQVREVLGATCVTLWTVGRGGAAFQLSGSQGAIGPVDVPFEPSYIVRSLLQSETLVTVQDPASDPRLKALMAHPVFLGRDEPKILAPVKIAGRLLGFFVAERSTGMGRWKSDEEMFMMSVTNMSAGILWHQLRTPHPMKSQTVNAETRNRGNSASSRNRVTASTARPRIAPQKEELYWEIDAEARITVIEGDVENIYGYSSEALLGQCITFLSDHAQGQRDMAQFASMLAGDGCLSYETWHRRADGTLIHLVVRGKPVRDAESRIVGLRGMLLVLRVAIAS